MGSGGSMSNRRRLDALARALGNLPTVGDPCSACGYPQRLKRVTFGMYIEDELGQCSACGRHLDLKDDDRPLEAEHLSVIVRGSPPPGWIPPDPN